MRKFLVVDDMAGLARSISRLLSTYGKVAQVGTVRGAEAEIAAHPHLSALIVDLCLPDGTGLLVLQMFRERFPNTPALMLTGFPDSESINAAYDLKAVFLAKPFNAIRIHEFVRSKVLMRHRASPANATGILTERERQVIQRAQQGLDDRKIAWDLGIAPSTVRWLFSRASGKLGALSRQQLLELVGVLGV